MRIKSAQVVLAHPPMSLALGPFGAAAGNVFRIGYSLVKVQIEEMCIPSESEKNDSPHFLVRAQRVVDNQNF